MESVHSRIINFSDGLESLTNKITNSRNVVNTNSIVSTQLTDREKNEIYKTGLGNKIIRLKVDGAYKEGVYFDSEQSQEYFENKLLSKVKKTCHWQLAFGRGIIVLVEPNKTVSDPLSAEVNLNTVIVHQFDGSMVSTLSTNRDLKSPNYQKPNYYQVRGQNFHHSRVIDFKYVEPIEDEYSRYKYGGISEFELIYTQLVNDGIVERVTPMTLEKSSSIFYKLTGFNDAIKAGKESDILKYFSLLENNRNASGAGVMDAKDEVTAVTQTLSNLSETDTITLRRIAMVTGLPISELVGESVKGLNSTGDNEKSTLNSTISSLQINYLLAPLTVLCEKLRLGKPTFNKPDEMTSIEKADYDKKLLENASQLDLLGLDGQGYLKDNGFEFEEASLGLEEVEEDEQEG